MLTHEPKTLIILSLSSLGEAETEFVQGRRLQRSFLTHLTAYSWISTSGLVCVCVCVCVLHVPMCVEGSSFTGKCLNQTSGRDDKSALWFGAQRLAVGSKRSTALQLCRFQRAKFNHHHFLLGAGTRAHLPTSCLAHLSLVA